MKSGREDDGLTLEFCLESRDEMLEFVFFECGYYVCWLDCLLASNLRVFV